jgi:tetratricopeptide (TPR) repeat protein
MKKSPIFIFTAFIFCCTLVRSQILPDFETNTTVEKATYPEENLNKALWKNLTYPMEALQNQIQGDVILSFVINKNGKLDSINVVSSPSGILSLSSVASLNGIGKSWNPCKINGAPVDKTYLLIYRYRIWLNVNPPEYGKQAEKMIEKQKYDKALKLYDKAIAENKFDYKLVEARSKLEEIMGDTEKAEIDLEQANRLKNEIISVVDVTVLSQSYTRSLGTTVTSVPRPF